jgi:hypothetical protein
MPSLLSERAVLVRPSSATFRRRPITTGERESWAGAKLHPHCAEQWLAGTWTEVEVRIEPANRGYRNSYIVADKGCCVLGHFKLEQYDNYHDYFEAIASALTIARLLQDCRFYSQLREATWTDLQHFLPRGFLKRLRLAWRVITEGGKQL